ncbi:MAG: class I SAM-dependent methyltransferase [Pseudonocardiaceae bacterium]
MRVIARVLIGTDTLSLTRLGARMTGLDFSAAALAQARRLAERAGADIDFHETEVYDAVGALGAEAFDLVYTGIGVLCWLPDVARWARVVADPLRPGGRLFIRGDHSMLQSLDDTSGVLTVRCALGGAARAHGRGRRQRMAAAHRARTAGRELPAAGQQGVAEQSPCAAREWH